MASNKLGSKNWRPILAMLMLLLGILALAKAPAYGMPSGASSDNSGNSGASQADPAVAAPNSLGKPQLKHAQGTFSGPVVGYSVMHDTSPPLRSIRPTLGVRGPGRSEGNENPPVWDAYKGPAVQDSVVQKFFGPFAMPTPIRNFDGMYNHWGPLPPDTNGDVGLEHYVQTVNSGFQIWTKQGLSLYGPADINTLFRGFRGAGGVCEDNNDGDPIVLYDPMANRWNISQFTSSPPYHQCIAVSATADPLGAWHRYAFPSDPNRQDVFGDYPHLGVWPDAYYMTTNQFEGGSGGGNFAFERSAMLNGTAARYVKFTIPSGGGLPSDMDGLTPPPVGSPNYFMFPQSSGAGLLREYKFHVDWTSPLSSTFTQVSLSVAPWNPNICAASRGQCIDQPSTTTKLEAIADRFMHRLAYRNMGTYESLLAYHTVNISSTTPGLAGLRWYEIRSPGAITPTLYQQGTYSQNDGTHRWMGSIAMDRAGDIAIGFSASSTVISPSIRYAGRLPTDPLGQMAQGEATLLQGQGVEDFPGTGRWGDYSAMSVDPSDDCTFWYTQEYFQRMGDRNWRTRIGSFKFPGCGPAPTPTPCPMNFTDVQQSDWHYEWVRCLFCRGAISGYSDGTFRPNNNTTRGQLSKIIAIARGWSLLNPTTPTFNDVPRGSTFYQFIETAYSRNIISGYNCGTGCLEFRPNNDVTRGQLSKIIVLAMEWLLINPATARFTDVLTTDTFYSFVETAACRQIISGYTDSTFRPGNSATRAQISKMVCLAARNEVVCNVAPRTNTPTVTPTSCAGGMSATGSITGSDLVMMGRLNRGNPPSSCAAPNSCPGAFGAVPRRYDVYTYTNTLSTTQCVSVRLRHACGDNHLLTAAFLGSFNPSSLCANYLADMGSGGPEMTYSFNLPTGQVAVIIVNEGVPDLGCSTYTIAISPCAGVSTNTPTPTVPVTATPTISCAGTTYNVITTTATLIPNVTNDIGNSCDDCMTEINLPFPVTVYGTPYSSANIGSNGVVQFAGTPQPNIFQENCLPVNTGATQPPFLSTLFAYYDDLRTDAGVGYGIFTATIGTAPNRQFVLRWKTTYFNGPGDANFEVVITEGSQMLSVIHGASEESGLNGATGMQRDLNVYTAFTCHTAGLTDGLRVNYMPVPLACGTNTPTRTATTGVPTNTNTPTRTNTPGGNTPTPTPTQACGGPGTWSDQAVIPVNRGRALGVTHNNSIYVFGGRPDNTTFENTIYRHDPTANTWTLLTQTLPDLLTSNMGGGVLTFPEGQRIFIAGGSGTASAVTGRTMAFNPTDGTFTTKTAWPASPARLPGGWIVANNKLYVFGGFKAAPAPAEMRDEMWVYDPMANSWTELTPRLGLARGYIATELMPDGLIYLAGGSGLDAAGALTDETIFEKFNPTNNTLTTGPVLPIGTSNNHGYNVQGKFLVPAGGFTKTTTNLQIYDPAANSWSQGPVALHPLRNYSKGYGPGGSIHAIGGLDAGATAFFNFNQKYTPGGACGTPTNTPVVNTPTPTPTGSTPTRTATTCVAQPTWQAGPTLTPGVYAVQGALGSDNNFYVAGGQLANNTPVAQAARFSATTNAWSLLPPMQVASGQISMGAASNGKVYVAGGYIGGTGGTAVTSTLQIFDIATNRWSFGPSMPGAKEAAAGIVVGTRFYVIGGDDFTSALTTNYIYDITANSWSTGAPLPLARTNTYATAVGNIIYLFGGADDQFNAVDTLFAYNTTSNTWSTLASAGTGGMGNYAAISTYGAGTLLATDGGNTAFQASNTTHIYNIVSNTWSVGPNLSVARLGHAQATLADGRVVVWSGLTTGTPQQTTATTEILAPRGACGPTNTPTSTPTIGGPTQTATRTSTPGAGCLQGTVLFSYNVEAVTTPPMNVALGVEYALGFYWVTGRDSTSNAKKIVKLSPTGQFVAEYPQEACASTTFGYRDLAFDGQFLWTADECGVDKIDPNTGARVGGFATPPGIGTPSLVRGLAFDPVARHFFAANFSSSIVVFDMKGSVVRTMPNPTTPTTAIYGIGFDSASAGGPYLWVWSQNAVGGAACPGGTAFCNRATRLNPTTGATTGVAFDGAPISTGADVSGGADVDVIDGTITLVTLHQATPDTIRGYCIGGGGGAPTNTPTRTATPGLQGIQIQGFAFTPQTVTVTLGTVVRWTNFDTTAHTSTSTSAPPVWDSGLLNQNEFYQRTFSVPGTYAYRCTPHASMTGTIIVTGSSDQPPPDNSPPKEDREVKQRK